MSFLLVTSEFLPNGVLTEMAAGLGLSPGVTGLTVSITAFAGLITAPTVSIVFPRLDRRTLLTIMALIGALSNIVVAFAPSFALILVSRFALGIAITTYWSMSISLASRLAGPGKLGRALMFVSGGTSLATVAGVPVGVLLAQHFDWRTVFAIIGVVMLVLAVLVRTVFPTIPAGAASGFRVFGEVLRVPGVALGLIGHALIIFGHFVAYTYVRLALERVSNAPDATQLDPGTIVVLLALFGLGGLIGNVIIGFVVDRVFTPLSITTPVFIAAAIFTIMMLPGTLVPIAIAISVWGCFFASWLIIVNTWIGYRAPQQLEAGGGLVVLGFQVSITIAAGLGGVIVDRLGVTFADAIGVTALLVGALLFALSQRRR